MLELLKLKICKKNTNRGKIQTYLVQHYVCPSAPSYLHLLPRKKKEKKIKLIAHTLYTDNTLVAVVPKERKMKRRANEEFKKGRMVR